MGNKLNFSAFSHSFIQRLLVRNSCFAKETACNVCAVERLLFFEGLDLNIWMISISRVHGFGNTDLQMLAILNTSNNEMTHDNFT